MSRPPKNPADRRKKLSYSIHPDLLAHLENYRQKEERTMSWVIEKALIAYLTDKGEM